MPKFTIITPSFNQASFLEETILSVINQTYRDFEFMIIDGGSSDNSVEIIKKYEKYLVYWCSEKDSGQSEAINKGLSKAKGDIITWLNSDDLLELNALELAVKEFDKNPGTFLIHGKTILFGEGIKKNSNGPDKQLLAHEYLPYMRFPQPSSFLRKEIFETCKNVNASLHYSMDFELIVKANLLGFKFKQVDTIFSHYRIHKDSKSNHEMKFLREWEVIVCNALGSLKNGKVFLKNLLDLGIGKNYKGEKYECHLEYTAGQLQEVMLEHLYLQYHYHYRAGDRVFCGHLSRWMATSYPEFYKARQFKKYDFRQNAIPLPILKLIRRLKN